MNDEKSNRYQNKIQNYIKIRNEFCNSQKNNEVGSYPTILAQKNQQKKQQQYKNQKQTLTHAYKKTKKKSRINNAKRICYTTIY